MGKRKLNFLLTEHRDGWVARCLEHNFVTQADTLNDLYHEIQRTIVGHIMISLEQGRQPFEGMASAPTEYWEMYERSRLTVGPTASKMTVTMVPSGEPAAPIEAPDSELRVALAVGG